MRFPLLLFLTLILLFGSALLSRHRRIGIAAFLLPVAVLLALLWLVLPKPVSEDEVWRKASKGTLIEELISVVGEPHEKHMNADGSGSLHYYGDRLGITGVGVAFDSKGRIENSWIE